MNEESNNQQDKKKDGTLQGTSGFTKRGDVTQQSEEDEKRLEEQRIDESLDESFPASDPPAHHSFN